MKAMNFYAGAMKAAMSFVAKRSSDDHIHSVHWTEVSHMGISGDYLDVEIETTTKDGEAGHRWNVRVVKYDNEKSFSIQTERTQATKL